MPEPLKYPVVAVTRTLRYLRHRYVAAPERASQAVARTNAAQASAVLRERRLEKGAVDDYLRASRSQDS